MAANTSILINIGARTADAVKGIGQVNKALGDQQTKTQRVQGATQRMAVPAAAAFAAVSAAAVGLAKAGETASTSNARIEQTFKAIGETTNTAAKEAIKYGEALARQTGIDTDTVKLAQSKLATFKAVSDETARSEGIYNRATTAAADLAASGFGSMDATAVQLGKALQDPVKGMTALTRVGVTFTEAQQSQIAAMVEANDVAGAQKLILAAVEGQVGGVAAATANSSDQMKIGFQQASQALGQALLPALEALTPIMASVAGFIQENSTVILALGAAVGVASGGILALNAAFKAFTAIKAAVAAIKAMNLALLANPYVLIIAAVIAVVALIIANWDKVKAFILAVWDKIKAAAQAVWGAIKLVHHDLHQDRADRDHDRAPGDQSGLGPDLERDQARDRGRLDRDQAVCHDLHQDRADRDHDRAAARSARSGPGSGTGSRTVVTAVWNTIQARSHDLHTGGADRDQLGAGRDPGVWSRVWGGITDRGHRRVARDHDRGPSRDQHGQERDHAVMSTIRGIWSRGWTGIRTAAATAIGALLGAGPRHPRQDHRRARQPRIVAVRQGPRDHSGVD